MTPDPAQPIDPTAPTVRFTVRAADYARHRPGYPDAAFDAMLAGLGDPNSLRAADIGAGTGIASRALADRGAHVVAIEPNAAMRGAAAPHPRVRWAEAMGERTGLADASVGLVVCAQSFHWLDAATALPEFRRILAPGGRLAIVWNGRSPGHPASEEYYRVTRALAIEEVGRRRSRPVEEPMRAAGFDGVRTMEFAGGQTLDLGGLIGRARSASYMPKDGPGYERLVQAMRALHAAHAGPDGTVFVAYRTTLHLGESCAR